MKLCFSDKHALLLSYDHTWPVLRSHVTCSMQEKLPPSSPRFHIQMTTSGAQQDELSDEINNLAGSAPQDDVFKEASKLRNLTFEKARENIVIKMPTMTLKPQNEYLKVQCYMGRVSALSQISGDAFYPGMFKMLTRVSCVGRALLSCMSLLTISFVMWSFLFYVLVPCSTFTVTEHLVGVCPPNKIL